MKVLKVILIVLVVLFGAYCIWMATLPSEFEVKRDIDIEASPDQVYTVVSDFETWPEWSSWFQMDSAAVVTYGETKAGEGASYTWSGEIMGKGEQQITAATPGESMETAVTFEDMGTSYGHWKFNEIEGGTNVVWSFTGELPFLFRVMSYGMETQVGGDFEKGLASLKTYVEANKKADIEVSETTVEALPYFSITKEIPMKELTSEFFGENYGKILAYLEEDAQNIKGAPFAIVHVWDEENETTKVEAAIPVESEKEGTDEIVKGMSYAGPVVKTNYYGPYEGTGAAHVAIESYLKANNLSYAGSPWESYVTDPTTEPDTAKWLTEVYYPVMK